MRHKLPQPGLLVLGVIGAIGLICMVTLLVHLWIRWAYWALVFSRAWSDSWSVTVDKPVLALAFGSFVLILIAVFKWIHQGSKAAWIELSSIMYTLLATLIVGGTFFLYFLIGAPATLHDQLVVKEEQLRVENRDLVGRETALLAQVGDLESKLDEALHQPPVINLPPPKIIVTGKRPEPSVYFGGLRAVENPDFRPGTPARIVLKIVNNGNAPALAFRSWGWSFSPDPVPDSDGEDALWRQAVDEVGENPWTNPRTLNAGEQSTTSIAVPANVVDAINAHSNRHLYVFGSLEYHDRSGKVITREMCRRLRPKHGALTSAPCSVHNN